MLVNNIYFEREKRASLESGEVLKGGIFTQQGFEFEPGRAWLDVGKVHLGQLHSAQRLRIEN